MEEYVIDTLVKKAKEASINAFVPDSNVAVGAAIAGERADYVGATVECSAKSAGCCAERVALYNGISQGDTSFFAMAVYSAGDALPYPCGTCLQALSDFSDDMEIALVCENDIKVVELKALLPHPVKWED
jgi:Cytidine deaminase